MKIFTRLCVLLFVFASHTSLAQARTCDEPFVSFGEVSSGLQAAFTGGSVVINDNNGEPIPLPSGFFLAASGEHQRGFIDLQSGSGWKCDGDWGVLIMWTGCVIEQRGRTIRTPREALECAKNVLFESLEFRVDGVTVDSVATQAKIGAAPAQFVGIRAAIKSNGGFLAPNTLAIGSHIATVVLHLTPEVCASFSVSYPCSIVFGNNFEVIAD